MNKPRKSVLKDYMSKKDRDKLGTQDTTHFNCKKATGVARPGKTARDRAKMIRLGDN